MIVGYTTGVFDLFHIGHLNVIKNAKALCDKLIVGVTTDELSISFKGKKAIIPFKERFEIIKALKYVDEVVPQTNMDKLEAWKKYKFDILFVSTNPPKKSLKVEQEFEKKVKEQGTKPLKLVRLPYTPGVSSTLRGKLLEDEC